MKKKSEKLLSVSATQAELAELAASGLAAFVANAPSV